MCSAQNKNAPFATLFSSDAFNIKGERIMGRQAAGNSYLKALFHEKYDNLDWDEDYQEEIEETLGDWWRLQGQMGELGQIIGNLRKLINLKN